MDKVEKGKKLVICVIIISLLYEIFTFLLNNSTGNVSAFKSSQSVIRFALECLLSYLLHKGHNWARIVSVILSGIAGIVSLIFTFIYGWLMLVLGIPFMVCFFILISEPVKAYQKYKRTGNTSY